MKRNRGESSVRMAELFMGPFLADFFKSESFENGYDFVWFKCRDVAHSS